MTQKDPRMGLSREEISNLLADLDTYQNRAEADLARKEVPLATWWAVVLLISVGSILVIATLAFQFGLLELLLERLLCQKDCSLLPSESLPTSEFITAISLGTILVAFGAVFRALLRMYQLKARAESVRIHLKNRAQIIQTLAESQTRTTGQGK